jgi:hypothetical protein
MGLLDRTKVLDKCTTFPLISWELHLVALI